MSENELGFETRFQRILDDATGLRMELDFLEFGPVEDPRSAKLEQLKYDGKSAIAEQFGKKVTGLDVLDVAEYQMRLGGMSNKKAQKSAEVLGKLVFLRHDDRAPTLIMGGQNIGLNPYVVLYGTEQSGAPYISVENTTDGKRPYIRTGFPNPVRLSSREGMRCYKPNDDWRMQFKDDGPNFKNLSVTDDPNEFEHHTSDRLNRNVMLIGAEAVTQVLPSLVGEYGSSKSLETVKRFVLNAVDSDLKIGDETLEKTVSDLIFFTSSTNESMLLPIQIHGKILREFDPESLKAEIIYQLLDKNKNVKFMDRLGREIIIAHKRGAAGRSIQNYQKMAMVGVADMLDAVGYDVDGSFIYESDLNRFNPLVVSALTDQLLKTPKRNLSRRKRLANEIIDLDI